MGGSGLKGMGASPFWSLGCFDIFYTLLTTALTISSVTLRFFCCIMHFFYRDLQQVVLKCLLCDVVRGRVLFFGVVIFYM